MEHAGVGIFCIETFILHKEVERSPVQSVLGAVFTWLHTNGFGFISAQPKADTLNWKLSKFWWAMAMKMSRCYLFCKTVRRTELTFLPNLVLKLLGLSPELRRHKCGRVYIAAMFLLCVVYETFKVYIHIRRNSFENLYLVRWKFYKWVEKFLYLSYFSISFPSICRWMSLWSTSTLSLLLVCSCGDSMQPSCTPWKSWRKQMVCRQGVSRDIASWPFCCWLPC